MPTEPPHKPHSVATDLDVIDLGYASLYSKWWELYLYLTPVFIVLSAVVGWLAFKAGASRDATVALIGGTLIAGSYIKWAVSMGFMVQPLCQTWKFAGALVTTKTTAHVFTAAGVELESTAGPTLLPWTSISRVVETKKGFLFYRDGKLATFLPSRSLEGSIEADLIRKFIRKNIADATLLG
ncbi:MAG: YcxB family protein [Candidatus Acidiferrum sp.]|jgi:hypothetical protein